MKAWATESTPDMADFTGSAIASRAPGRAEILQKQLHVLRESLQEGSGRSGAVRDALLGPDKKDGALGVGGDMGEGLLGALLAIVEDCLAESRNTNRALAEVGEALGTHAA